MPPQTTQHRPPTAARALPHRARLLAALALLLLPAGCTRVFNVSGVRLQSIDQNTHLTPAIVTSAYRAQDTSTAEFYLSDIPLRELSGADSFADLSGTIIHLHLFIRPKPGKTPIEPTASSATIQAVVLARGEVGVYGGGGFMLPSGTPGDDAIGGSIRSGSIKLLAATPDFADRLGAASFSAGFTAPKDEAAAGVMAHLFEQAVQLAKSDPPAPQ